MKTKLEFLKNFIKNRKEVWAILPSSVFLSKKIVDWNIIEKSEVIIEIWAWTWSFTKEIFKHKLNWKKIIIIEKDINFYKILIKKFPKYKQYIYNIDMLEIDKILSDRWINKIDLLISWIPFKSLPKEIFYIFMDKIIKYFHKDTYFFQFSYFKNTKKKLKKYFKNINITICFLNFPIAFIFKCKK